MSRSTRLTELVHAVLDGEASESQTRELELRLAADPAARAEFDEWQRLFRALHEMPKEHPPEGLVAAVSAALPAAPAPSAALGQPFPPRRVFGYTSTRSSGSRLGEPRAIHPPIPLTRSVSMSQQSSRFFASRKGWLGAGIVAAAAVVVAQLGFDFPVAKDVMGTVAPAQRYRAAPNGSEDVKLAPPATPGAAIGIAPEANRAVAERTEAQKMAERTAAQMMAERTAAQKMAERTEAEMMAERTAAQKMAERTEAQKMAERTEAQMMAERTAAQKMAERTEANRVEAQRSMEKSTNRTAQP
jgi:anti-sigma factor RsiW